ncbi:3-hydroxyacyl-CoA dehydrogenase family protein [Flavihumibacter stibioxidans]|uniref:3-hydroxybutyryl-CoA dehydrogenase n=1 Tax=Flavihumibacter stibioxidans TaxID=1834163 RepID=A0ABR7M803_9BACT|nr:3-hydroxyacyl-CoA dehydrogenase NAD-binding domain-containing protein [Flavihumibacter stibioxidans]MBC6491142.1 3-hydroxybutyryl-CoA dehydrogenase [Flavihumibacter stibioxidans]
MIKTICVCGAGTMGSGIAQAAAQHGFHVLLYDLSQKVLDTARQQVEKNLQSLVEKKKISDHARQTILHHIRFVNEAAECVADLVIEAVVEKPEVKIALFRQLFAINGDHTVFASNTSSLSITAIAKELPDPSRVIGMHFFNPATIMRLVEIVRTDYTGDSVIQLVENLAIDMGKTPVICRDAPGFIVNRVARPYYIESLRMAEEGVPMALIDALMETAGFKMGPFRLMDLIGNDINYAVSCSVYEQLGKPERLKPSYIQQEKVESGQLGRKTGAGYYTY